MTTTVAAVPTLNGSRYLQQLAKHWSHRFDVKMTAEHAEIDFGNAETLILDASEDILRMAVTSGEGADHAALERVVTEHLQRFSFREELEIMWASNG